jgi:hypothetical protein
MIAEKLREIAGESFKAVAAAKLGALYPQLSEEECGVVDAALDDDSYSAAKTAAGLLDRLEEQRMRDVGTRVTKVQREILASAWDDQEYPFDENTPAECLEAALDLYNRGFFVRAESSEGRKYRLTPEGWELARVLCAP